MMWQQAGVSGDGLSAGESSWNKENRFTGWTDVPLSEHGQHEARSVCLQRTSHQVPAGQSVNTS